MKPRGLRILFLSKQFAVRRDFIADRYWRLWHLPRGLAARGHHVLGLAAAYRPGAAPAPPPETPDGGGSLRWETQRIVPWNPWSWLAHAQRVRKLAAEFRPDCVLASSDAWHLDLGTRIAAAHRAPCVLDFYDNYESFGASRIPGVTAVMSRAARRAQGGVFVSEPLRRHLVTAYGLRAPALVLENGVEPTAFATIAPDAARAELGLAPDAQCIGTAGALDATRGIEALYGAFERLARRHPRLHLVLAGDAVTRPPEHPRVRLVGRLPTARMPAFWRALDVAVICLRDDAFGRYCFPLKLGEVAAAGTPLVVPPIGVFAEAAAGVHGRVAATATAGGYAAAIEEQLARPRPPAWRPGTWDELAARLDRWLAASLAVRPSAGASA